MTDTMTDPTPDAPTDPAPGAPDGSAPADPAPSQPDSVPTEDKAKRGRGALEADVKIVCDDFANGKITLPDGELLTPHRIAKIIDAENPPSTGAVAANLDRWDEIGFAVVNTKPVAFVEYTDAARNEGLTALKAASSERKRAARKTAKEAEKAAAPVAAEPTPAPAEDDGHTQTV